MEIFGLLLGHGLEPDFEASAVESNLLRAHPEILAVARQDIRVGHRHIVTLSLLEVCQVHVFARFGVSIVHDRLAEEFAGGRVEA